MAGRGTPAGRWALVLALGLVLGPARAGAQAEAVASDGGAPTPARSAELSTLRGRAPDGGFDELAAAYVAEGLFAGDFGGGGGTAVVLATDVGARLGIERDARVRFDWGVAWSRQRVLGTFTTTTASEPYDVTLERTEARNADFALEWAPWVGTNARVLVGVGTAVPVAALASFGNANNGAMATPLEAAQVEASTATHAIWMAMHGCWAPWRYQADRIAAFAPLGAFFDLGAVELAVDGAAAVSFPVLGGAGGPEGALMLAAQLSGAPLPELTVGARASIVAYGLGGRGEGSQPAIEPFVRLELAPVSVTLRGVLNVGSGGGVRFGLGSEDGVWAVHLGVSVAADAVREAE